MSKLVLIIDGDEAQELLRGSAALQIDLVDALVEREPEPHELASDEDSRCKYLSKRCLRQRATKAKGEPHKLCTFHRAKAIVNQRRLEIKKRGRSELDAVTPTADSPKTPRKASKRQRSASAIQKASSNDNAQAPRKRKRAKESPATTTTVMLPAIDVDDLLPPVEYATKTSIYSNSSTSWLSPRDVFDLEPFRTPATLFPEDLEAVRGLVDSDVVSDMEQAFSWNFQV